MKRLRRAWRSLRVQMLLPVMSITIVIVLILSVLATHAYTNTVLGQEDEKTRSSLSIVGSTLDRLFIDAIAVARDTMVDTAVTRYAARSFRSNENRIRQRQECLSALDAVLSRQPNLAGIMVLREDGSAFGVLPRRHVFVDEPEQSGFAPETVRRIIETRRDCWLGPLDDWTLAEDEQGSVFVGVHRMSSRDYGVVYALAVVDAGVPESYLALAADNGSGVMLLDGESRVMGQTGPRGVEPLSALAALEGAASGAGMFKGTPAYRIAAVKLDSNGWTLMRQLPMESYYNDLNRLRGLIWAVAAGAFAVALLAYLSWQKRFLSGFDSLGASLVRIGRGELSTRIDGPYSITELEQIRREFNNMGAEIRTLLETTKSMERSQLELELRNMQTQLSPHMIFNSITAIRWMAIMVGEKKVADMLLELTEMLRPVFRDWKLEWTLREELAHLEHYARLLRLRFDNRFSMEIDVADDCLDAILPRFTLQPLVENTCEHGGVETERLRVRIEARLNGDAILLCVEDNGRGIEPEKLAALRKAIAEEANSLSDSGSIGIRNVSARLRIMMGAGSGMEVECPEDGGTRITLRFPAQRRNDGGDAL